MYSVSDFLKNLYPYCGGYGNIGRDASPLKSTMHTHFHTYRQISIANQSTTGNMRTTQTWVKHAKLYTDSNPNPGSNQETANHRATLGTQRWYTEI